MFLAPIPIGPFLIEEGGRLILRSPGSSPSFSFLWRNKGCTVSFTGSTMVLLALGGRVPSSADGRIRRDEALAMLRALPNVLPASMRLRLLPDYRIQIETRVDVVWPVTAGALIGPIVAMLIRLAPAFDLLEETGLASC